MKLANRNCNKVTAQAKKDYWLAFSDSVSAGKTDLGSVWKKIKKMKQQYVAPNFDLHRGNRVYTTDQAKADAFAEAFAEASNCEKLPADMRQFRREREAVYSDPAADDSLPVNSPLTCTELKRALASIKKVKVSTGLDVVSYQMLREVPESFLKTLLGFFQRCWDGGTIPAEWKHAVVVPIHKQGKARKEIASYRPISLTSHLGKVYERVIKRRLEYFCETKKVFPACQAGFRRGRGVTDHLVKLGEHVGRAMGRRKVLLSCFFDISRAYDQVWHARLLQKLQKIGLSGKIFNYIKTFLTGRSLQVRWKGAMSAAKQIDMGVPQGSVIAPLLFNIMVHDVESCVQGKVVLTMYADDLAIWLDTHIRRPHKENNRNMAISMKTFQEAVDGVIRFMQVNGFTLSTQKTVFLPFHICSRRIEDISIKVNDEHVFPADQVKYLGVVFQRMGRTNRHVDHNARNASRALNVIKVLSTQPWANPPKLLVSLVRSLVRSRLVYGLEAMPSITETGLKRLTAIEVRALRL
ncbi:MAG: reverse transcriptase family protein, partial [Sulfurovum sp.]|nr:reverse transcriptase family protein [Sulfurovum sp.]MCB4784533.1 reverse transcriptase family protein [Sulfurovum sp.]